MYKICIIGAGISGLLLLHLFEEAKVNPQDITIIDPYFDGGALMRKWPFVISNTKWEKTLEAIRLLRPSLQLEFSEQADKTTHLSKISKFVFSTISNYLQKTNIICGNVKMVEKRDECWKIITDNDQTVDSKTVFFCTGAKEKSLCLPIPTIPLSSALHFESIEKMVDSKDTVLLFGTMHSGCLVLDNLRKIGCQVKAVYKGEKPFLFARDGEYDGIKEDAATIADSILTNNNTNLEFISFDSFTKVASAIRKANWCIYCIGFEATQDFIILNEGGRGVSLNTYDSRTGKLPVENAWTFGIASPNRAPDGIHYDVSVLAFATHIYNQKESILQSL